jgi:long-subunit acyl-CoA synthetase (AMP-forming)
VTEQESLTDMVMANAERFGGAIGVRRRSAGSWADVTTREFAAQVLDIARGLVAAGLRAGDRVALLSSTRYEWSLFDFACWCAGLQTVPIDHTAQVDDVEWILADSAANAVVVETEAHLDAVRQVVGRLPELTRIWRLTGDEPAVDELVALGAGTDVAVVHRRRLAVHADDVATIVYPPERQKRVEVSHGELLAEVRSTIAALPALLRAGNSLLLLPPMADPRAHVVSLCCFYTRTTLGHLSHTDDEVASELGVFRPTVIVADADLVATALDATRERAVAEGRTGAYDAASAVATAYGARRGGSIALRLKRALADRVVYPKLRAVFGGRCVAVLTTGEPLPTDRTHLLRGIGIEVRSLP